MGPSGFSSSESLGHLFEALAKAQGEMEGAKKDSDNPFYHSKYAALSSVWDAIREPLSKNGLSVAQPFEETEKGLFVYTILGHASGERIVSRSFISTEKDGKLTEQARGSAITYHRRYGLQALVGIAPMDDDAEAAMGRQQTREDTAKTRRDASTKATGRKPKPSTPKPADAQDEMPMFNGPKHAALAARLKAEGIKEEDLMNAAKFAGLIPQSAKAFRLMSEATAAQFVDDPDVVGVIMGNWRKL